MAGWIDARGNREERICKEPQIMRSIRYSPGHGAEQGEGAGARNTLRLHHNSIAAGNDQIITFIDADQDDVFDIPNPVAINLLFFHARRVGWNSQLIENDDLLRARLRNIQEIIRIFIESHAPG